MLKFCDFCLLIIILFFHLLSDPFSMAPPKALETIGKALHTQYERWQPKVKTT